MPDIIEGVGDVLLKQKGFQPHFHIYILKSAKMHTFSSLSSIQASVYVYPPGLVRIAWNDV